MLITRRLKFVIACVAALGGGAMFASHASALPVAPAGVVAPAAATTVPVENVRLVCDRYGRCWRTRPRYYAPPRFYAPPRYQYRRHHYPRRHYHRHRHYRW